MNQNLDLDILYFVSVSMFLRQVQAYDVLRPISAMAIALAPLLLALVCSHVAYVAPIFFAKVLAHCGYGSALRRSKHGYNYLFTL